MHDEAYNLKIHLYGVQGSGSVFPSRAERQAMQELMGLRLTEKIFADLAQHAGPDGTIGSRIEDILGGQVTRQKLRSYLKQFQIEEPRIYGGWTTCVRIETGDGYDIVLDLGSGFRNCAQDLQQKWGSKQERALHVFGSHSHFDHTEGFDQAAVCFDPRNRIRIYGNQQFLRALDQNLGIFTHRVDVQLLGVQTPLHYGIMPAQFESCDIRDVSQYPLPKDGQNPLSHSYHQIEVPIQIGDTQIVPFEVFHPAPCLAYRIENGGRSFLFCTDHELRHGDDDQDPRQRASLQAEERARKYGYDVDVMYRDAQFFRAEYDGYQGIGTSGGVPRIDWGHSCIEDALDMAEACQIKTTYIGHHDPNRDWSERNWIDGTLNRRSDQTGLRFELACAETIITL